MRPELARNSRIDVAAVQVVAERLCAAAELIDNAIADHWARLTLMGPRQAGTTLRTVMHCAPDWSAWVRSYPNGPAPQSI